MKLIGSGIHSNIYTNEKEAIKIVNKEFEDLYIREICCIRYLNIILPNRKCFPKIVSFSPGKLSFSFEFFEKKLDEILKNDILDKKLSFSYLTQILSAFSDLHALGIVHNNIKLSKIMIRNNDEICLIDFGDIIKFQYDTKNRGTYLDLKKIGGIVLDLTLGEKFMNKKNPKILLSKINSLDNKTSNEIKSLMFPDKKGVRKVRDTLKNLQGIDIVTNDIKIEISVESPVYNIDKWVRALFKRFELDRTFEPIIVTTIICTVMDNKDPEYIIPYGILIVYMYSCIYGGSLKLKDCIEICPSSFGTRRFKSNLFAYFIRELLEYDNLIVMLFRGLD